MELFRAAAKRLLKTNILSICLIVLIIDIICTILEETKFHSQHSPLPMSSCQIIRNVNLLEKRTNYDKTQDNQQVRRITRTGVLILKLFSNCICLFFGVIVESAISNMG